MGGRPVFLVYRHVNVNLKGTGRFFCLYCEAERSYQRREWRITSVTFFVPLTRGGEFILCPACESAYDLECLDESSTAVYDELVVDVPDLVIQAAVRGRSRSSRRESLSAHSAVRRH